MKKDRLLLLLVAFGFLALTIETRYAHAGAWEENALAMAAPITCAIAFLACLVGVAAEKKLATFTGVVLVACAIAGAFGVLLHTGNDLGKLQTLVSSNSREQRLALSLDPKKQGQLIEERPYAAPLSVTGLALLGAAILLVPRKGNS